MVRGACEGAHRTEYACNTLERDRICVTRGKRR